MPPVSCLRTGIFQRWLGSFCPDHWLFHHDVARGAFHPPASKARPAVGGEGLLRRPSVGISVRDLYRRDISLQDVVFYF